jgi:hypothetical protein
MRCMPRRIPTSSASCTLPSSFTTFKLSTMQLACQVLVTSPPGRIASMCSIHPSYAELHQNKFPCYVNKQAHVLLMSFPSPQHIDSRTDHQVLPVFHACHNVTRLVPFLRLDKRVIQVYYDNTCQSRTIDMYHAF